jgi:SAM-dependent methyltransferase
MTQAALTIDDAAYFARLSELERTHWWSLGMWRVANWWLAKALAGQRGLQALDVGCGTGLGVVRLAGRPEIVRAIGLDPNPVALAAAQRLPGLPIVRGTILALPFDSASFDVLTCFDVLQHLPERCLHQALYELRRVVRRNGVAVVRSNTAPNLTTLEHLKTVFAESGFRVRLATYANCLPALASELRTLLAGRGREGHPAGRGLQIRLPHPWVNRAIGKIATAEAFVAGRLGVGLPFGHSTMFMLQVEADVPRGNRHADRN